MAPLFCRPYSGLITNLRMVSPMLLRGASVWETDARLFVNVSEVSKETGQTVDRFCKNRNESRITKYICSSSTPNLLSVLDLTSFAFGITTVVRFRREQNYLLSGPCTIEKQLLGGAVFLLLRGPESNRGLEVMRTTIVFTTLLQSDRFGVWTIPSSF